MTDRGRMSVGGRTREALKDPSVTPDQITVLASSLRENHMESLNQFSRSLLLFAASVATWTLIRSSHVGKITVFAVELNDLDVPAALLPILAGFAYYRTQAALVMAGLVHEALIEVYEVQLPSFAERNIDTILSPPTLLTFENSIRNIFSEVRAFDKIAEVSFVVTILALAVAPATVLAWMCYSLLIAPAFGIWWSIAVVAIVSLLVARTLVLFAHAVVIA